jgi:hypothetical protein
VRRSETPRELTKMMVDRWASTRCMIASSTWGQMLPRGWSSSPGASDRAPLPSSRGGAGILVMSSTGTWTSSASRVVAGGATTLTRAEPARNRATSSCGRTVALRPMRRAGDSRRASRRSSETARWAPRLVPATAWISSMMTVSTVRRVSRAAEVSIRNSDSGVVMRMSGGRDSSDRRSRCEVSPDRTPTVTSRKESPRRAAACVMPTKGERRLRSTSTANALSGEM